MSRAARLANYATASTRLAGLGDRQLSELVEQASPMGSGMGGTSARLEIDGVPVFVKYVPLTDLERRPENVLSTANLFQLPTFYQYGIGSAGFGVWRELAVHTMTTNWVLAHAYQDFPLMYHWRVLPGPFPQPFTQNEQDVLQRAVDYWDGSSAVRARLEAIGRSSARVVLFLEYIPQTLDAWFHTQLAEGGEAAESACLMVERSLRAGTSFMNSHDLLHFDPHFDNILTDGRRLYFGDYGLAVSCRFELSEAEFDFYSTHLSYDRCYTATRLVNWLTAAGCEARLPESAATIVQRYAPIAVVMKEFYRKLQTESRTTPYPVAEIERVWPLTQRL